MDNWQNNTIDAAMHLAECALSENDSIVLYDAVEKLGNFRAEQAVPLLCKIASSWKPDSIRGEAVFALAKIASPVALHSIVLALKDRNSYVVFKAHTALDIFLGKTDFFKLGQERITQIRSELVSILFLEKKCSEKTRRSIRAQIWKAGHDLHDIAALEEKAKGQLEGGFIEESECKIRLHDYFVRRSHAEVLSARLHREFAQNSNYSQELHKYAVQLGSLEKEEHRQRRTKLVEARSQRRMELIESCHLGTTHRWLQDVGTRAKDAFKPLFPIPTPARFGRSIRH